MATQIYCLILILTLLLGASRGFGQTHCDPQARQSLMDLSKRYITFLCTSESEVETKNCQKIIEKNWDVSLSCVNLTIPTGHLRDQVLSFMQDPQMRTYVDQKFFQIGEAAEIRRKIFEEFDVLVIPGGFPIREGLSKEWSQEDLQLLYEGYRKLKQSISAKVAKSKNSNFMRLSHLWGRGGAVALTQAKTICGQFGVHWSDNPMQFEVVTSLSQDEFSAEEVAQRIAHENAHSLDYFWGGVRFGPNSNWSETSWAQIFSICEVEPHYKTNLTACSKQNEEWFNFHSSKKCNVSGHNYAASSSAEFYTKMLDEWVREGLGIIPDNRYRCQSEMTKTLWDEMEFLFLGESFSGDCLR